MIPPVRDVMQEHNGDYQVYAVKGSPNSIGKQMASHHRGPDGPRLRELSDEQIAFARLCASAAYQVHAPMVQELESWATACELPLDEAFFYFSVGMTETSRRGRSRRNPTQAESAGGPDHVAPENAAGGRALEVTDEPAANPISKRNCSTVGVMTEDGPVIGRNFDLHYQVRTRHLVSTEPSGYLPHRGMYDGLVAGRTDGMNNEGLFASLHTVRARPPEKRRPGIFCVHVVRAALELCKTAKEAAEFTCSVSHIAPFNYFFADPNDMLVVEAHPERTRVRRAKDGVLACTNHYVHPEMSDLLYAVPANSAARLEFLAAGVRSLVAEPHSGLSRAESLTINLLSDHTVPVCWHTETMSTLWSAVAAPSSRALRYSLGPPCRTSYS